MPDDWETTHGLDPSWAGDAALDSDQDGLSNLAEFLAGTDPRNPASVLRLRAAVGAGGAASLTFTATAGHTYTLFYTETLTTPVWRKLQEIPATEQDRIVEVTDPRAATGSPRFYLLRSPGGN